MALLVIGVILMMLGIFRFTFYRTLFKKTFKVLGFTITPEMVSIALFIIGLVLLLLFLVTHIQPLFYKGREMQQSPYGS